MAMPKVFGHVLSVLILMACSPAADAAGRVGSHRVGGHGSHGKGSHYVGGHKSTAVGRFIHKHL